MGQRLFIFFKVSKGSISKEYQCRPDEEIKNQLTCQDFSPVAENMGVYNNKAVIKFVEFYRCSE